MLHKNLPSAPQAAKPAALLLAVSLALVFCYVSFDFGSLLHFRLSPVGSIEPPGPVGPVNPGGGNTTRHQLFDFLSRSGGGSPAPVRRPILKAPFEPNDAITQFDRQIGTPPWSKKDMQDHFIWWLSACPQTVESSVRNNGGMRLFHAWFITFIIHWLKPDTVIESGAHKGLGTKVIRSALGPDGKIIVVTPNLPSSYVDNPRTSKYFTNATFKDFNQISWDEEIPNKSKTLVFFDDHQAGERRVREARKFGFHHIVFDDNAPPMHNDNYGAMYATLANTFQDSLPSKYKAALAIYKDNFGKKLTSLTTEAQSKIFNDFNSFVEIYFTSPPLWISPKGHTYTPKGLDPRFFKEPLFLNGAEWDNEFPEMFEKYNFMSYLKVSTHVPAHLNGAT